MTLHLLIANFMVTIKQAGRTIKLHYFMNNNMRIDLL